MKALLYKDTFPRLLADMRERPGKWLSRLVFLLGPWACLWMVEILNENDIFSDLDGWQVLMNLVWYYGLFFVLRLVLGRNRRAAALGACPGLHFRAGQPLCPTVPGPYPVSSGYHRVAHRRQCGGWL